MQRVREPTLGLGIDDIAPSKASRRRAAIDAGMRSLESPARERLAMLQAAHTTPAGADSPEPAVATWDGWVRVAVLIAGAALSWAAVIGIGWWLLDR